MIANYTLLDDGKHLAEWSEQNRRTPPPQKFVMIPRHILDLDGINGIFQRSAVKSCTESGRGVYAVELEAIKMPVFTARHSNRQAAE